jgi:hypothetical protein
LLDSSTRISSMFRSSVTIKPLLTILGSASLLVRVPLSSRLFPDTTSCGSILLDIQGKFSYIGLSKEGSLSFSNVKAGTDQNGFSPEPIRASCLNKSVSLGVNQKRTSRKERSVTWQSIYPKKEGARACPETSSIIFQTVTKELAKISTKVQ